MKIKPQHVDHIHNAMMNYSFAPLLQDYLAKGLTEKRWRWDWCYKTPGLSHWIANNIYSYANDDHLDTVLRKITRCED